MSIKSSLGVPFLLIWFGWLFSGSSGTDLARIARQGRGGHSSSNEQVIRTFCAASWPVLGDIGQGRQASGITGVRVR